jgi:hypothetical protein
MARAMARAAVAATAAAVGLVALAAAGGAAQTPPAGAGTEWAVSASRYLADVRALSSDDLQGRGNGEPGLDTAAEMIARRFQSAGLAPAGEGGGWFQRFELEVRTEPTRDDALVLRGAPAEARFELGQHYYPLSIVDATTAPAAPALEAAPVVFAGYAIAAPAFGYDDFAGLDVAGAAVVAFTHEPQEDDPRSVFDGRQLTPHADVGAKATQAARRGARLLLLVEDPSHGGDRASYPGWRRDPQADTYAIPVVRVLRSRLAEVLGLDLDRLARDIDRTLVPRSRRLAPTADYTERLTRTRKTVRNVVGVLRGRTPALRGEAVVLGAHYDHLGRSGQFSMAAASDGEVHNGADDNASGTAALIEAARAAAASAARFGRTLVFVAFAGEELGLHGSEHYAAHPVVPLDRTAAMINLDMVGRAVGRVMVGGADKWPQLAAPIAALRGRTTLRVDDFTDGYEDGDSDGASFSSRGVPTAAFFTGFHGDYHRPSDDWERIDPQGGVDVVRLALELAARLAGRSR